MADTLTTSFGWPLGFRRARSPWQQDLPSLLAFAKQERFASVDYGPITVETASAALKAGVPIGTVDLQDWSALLSQDAGRRAAAVIANASHVRAMAEVGVRRFLTVLAPERPEAPRQDNFAAAVESYRLLGRAAEECGARVLVEGAPGRPPHFANLACTPADARAFLKAVDCPAIGINYDPSHLVRMGIDPVRFLREFSPHIHHVHAKDTLFLPEARYEHGSLQQPTFDAPWVYGGMDWRYVLPGRGEVPWRRIFEHLKAADYDGAVSIELEDADYLGTADTEQQGLREAARFLQAV